MRLRAGGSTPASSGGGGGGAGGDGGVDSWGRPLALGAGGFEGSLFRDHDSAAGEIHDKQAMKLGNRQEFTVD